jgi:hypothetical protein
MEASSSETLVSIYQTTRCYVTEEAIFGPNIGWFCLLSNENTVKRHDTFNMGVLLIECTKAEQRPTTPLLCSESVKTSEIYGRMSSQYADISDTGKFKNGKKYSNDQCY